MVFSCLKSRDLETTTEYLKSSSDDKAKAVYEGTYNLSGEVQSNPALARQFASYADLQADGRFTAWADTLYSALFSANITSFTRQAEESL